MVDKDQIRKISRLTAEYAAENKLIPPLQLEELKSHTHQILKKEALPAELEKWILLFLNNALWLETLKAIPYRRRLLLIPQCLKHPTECKAEIDELGLLCDGCGKCVINDILDKAEDLDIMCIVAEGSTMTAQIIEKGQADALIGVGCFSALEKAFDQMISNAIPGLALPLFSDGCINTSADVEYLLQMITQKSDHEISVLHPKRVLAEVRKSFSHENLEYIMGPAVLEVDKIARDYFIQTGKRNRPFLCFSTAKCLGHNDRNDRNDLNLSKLAVAVECFHKASLIHDDIEDNDEIRNGFPALHITHGLGTALNTGDLLIGEGYRMLSQLKVSPEKKAKLLDEAVKGHLSMCYGQGKELLCTYKNQTLNIDTLIAIFRRKTAPAFNVAFQFGAILMDASDDTRKILAGFSDHLGIGYQIRDDILDTNLHSEKESDQIPTIVELIMQEQGIKLEEALKNAKQLLAKFRGNALAELKGIQSIPLKSFLFQVTHNLLKK